MKNILPAFILLMFFTATGQNKESKASVENASRTTVSAFFDSLAEKDPEKIASFIAEDVDWYIYESGKFPWTGKRSKRSEIPAVFKTLFSYFVDGKEEFTLDSFLVDGNDVAVFAELGRQFRSSGKSFKMPIAIHLRVENGLITKFYLYEQTKVLEKAFKK